MDEFDSKSLEPMLFFETDVFDSKDYIYELKLDGARCLAYLEKDKTTLINKRLKDISNTYPELLNIHQASNQKCVVDGELVAMVNGKPSFFSLQKRALSTNPFKIKQMLDQIPITFVCYDILYYDDHLVVNLPLMERKKLLEKTIKENNQISISRYIEEQGTDFFHLAKANDLEGIVAKKKDSLYYLGKRSRVWLKIKVYQDEDYLICGYVPNEYGIKDIIFGAYDENHQIYHVATVMSAKNKDEIMEFASKNPSSPLFKVSQENVVWMEPFLVGTLQFMMKTKNGGLRQAVFKGLRDDKVIN